MNAKDLRIGNLVQEDVSGLSRNGIVNLIKNYRVSIKLPFSNLAIDTKNLKPIELTEEILEKLGFKNENINYVKNNVTIYFYDCWHFDYEDERGFNNVRLTGFWKVHQLQNLYFAITGEELVVSDAVS